MLKKIENQVIVSKLAGKTTGFRGIVFLLCIENYWNTD